MDPRAEWVKCEYGYGEDPIVVGCILPAKQSGWIFFRSTRDTAYHTRLQSPCGLDVGTIRYLAACPWVTRVAVHLRGTGQIYRAPVSAFVEALQAQRGIRETQLLKSRVIRLRLFLPVAQWELLRVDEPYSVMKVPYDDETRIRATGEVLWRRSSAVTTSI